MKHEDGERARLDLVINFRTKLALERLASCYGVTQIAMLERLILQGQQTALDAAAKHSPNGEDDYYDSRLKLLI